MPPGLGRSRAIVAIAPRGAKLRHAPQPNRTKRTVCETAWDQGKLRRMGATQRMDETIIIPHHKELSVQMLKSGAVVVVLYIAGSSGFYCFAQGRDFTCATEKAEVDKLEQWVSYDRRAKTPNLTTNLAKLAAANAALRQCRDASNNASQVRGKLGQSVLATSPHDVEIVRPRGRAPTNFSIPLNAGKPEAFKEQPWWVTKTIEWMRRPKFYPGDSVPFHFEELLDPNGKPLGYDFGDYRVFFYYDGRRLLGATAADPTGARMLAEVRIDPDPDYSYEGYTEALEIHYDAQTHPVHVGRSVFVDLTGEKVGEDDELRKKEKEYFFLIAPLFALR